MKNLKNKIGGSLLVVSCLLLVIGISTTSWAVPQMINIQGRLTDTVGSPVNKLVKVDFRIYSHETKTGSQYLDWEELNLIVDPDENGIFNQILGLTTPIPDITGEDHYLSIWILGEAAEMLPRQRLVSVLYAITARNLRGGDIAFKGSATGSTSDDCGISEMSGYLNLKPSSSSYGILLRDYDSSTWSNIETTDTYLTLGWNSGDGPLYITSNSVGIGTTSMSQGKLEIYGNQFNPGDVWNGNTLFIAADGTAGIGNYVGGIGFDRLGGSSRRKAGIAAKQTGADADQIGLAFFTHPGTEQGFNNISESVVISHTGLLRIQSLSGAGDVYSSSTGYFYNVSDQRFKKNIKTISDQIDVIDSLKQLRGVYYNWDTDVAKEVKGLDFDDKTQMGMIAQEVEKVIPELVGTDKEGYKTLSYSRLVGFLVEVNKNQQKEFEGLKQRIGELEKK